jgi:hypothetical protein
MSCQIWPILKQLGMPNPIPTHTPLNVGADLCSKARFATGHSSAPNARRRRPLHPWLNKSKRNIADLHKGVASRLTPTELWMSSLSRQRAEKG